MDFINKTEANMEGPNVNYDNGTLLSNGFFTPVDSLTGSLDSLFSTDITDELDGDEFALPEITDEREPSLLEALRCSPPPVEEWLSDDFPTVSPLDERISSNSSSRNEFRQVSSGKPLYIETVSSVSRQLQEAEHRGDAGAAISLSAWRSPGQPDSEVRIAAGTLHGRVLVWRGAILRWATTGNADSAVTALTWRSDGARILACFARGIAVEFEALRGQIMRQVSIDASALWIGWAGLTAAILLDASGTAWLLRCTKLFGSRSLKCSRLSGGESGSALAAAPLDTKAIALAGTKRLLILCGNRVCSASLRGHADSMPLLCWTERNAEKPVLVSARGHFIQMHSVCLSKPSPSLTLLSYIQLTGATLFWLGEFENKLVVLNSDEHMYTFSDRENPDDYLDVSSVKIVYSSPFYKGVWSGDNSVVSKAVSAAGNSAAGSALTVTEGTLLILGRSGVVRIKRRDAAARAATGCWDGALRTALTEEPQSALKLLHQAFEAGALQDPQVASAAVQVCLRHGFMDDLWGEIWVSGGAQATAEQLTLYNDRSTDVTPPAHILQELLTLMAKVRGTVEASNFAQSVAGASPASAAAALQWCQSASQWDAAVGVCVASGSAGAPLRLLSPLICHTECSHSDCCPRSALLRHTANTLASDKHAERYESLDALLRGGIDSANSDGLDVHQNGSALFALLNCNPLDTLAMLHKALLAPPFIGPLGRHNRQRLLRSLLDCCQYLTSTFTIEVLEFVNKKIVDGVLIMDTEIEKMKTEITQKLLANDEEEENIKLRLQQLTNRVTTDAREESLEVSDNISATDEIPTNEEPEEEDFGWPALVASASRADCTRALSRVTAKEAASRLARSLREGSHALACSSTCSRCGRPLAGFRTHAAWCGHAWHSHCDPGGAPPPVCTKCGHSWPLATLTSNGQAIKSQTVRSDLEFNLCLTAPPRLDLEGIL